MSGSYVKMEYLAEEVFRRKAAGETNREIVEEFGLSLQQIKGLVKRQTQGDGSRVLFQFPNNTKTHSGKSA